MTKTRKGPWPPNQPCTKCGFLHPVTYPCPKSGDRWRESGSEEAAESA